MALVLGRSGYIRSDAGAFQNRSALLSSELSRTDLTDNFRTNAILVPFESAFKGLSNDTKIIKIQEILIATIGKKTKILRCHNAASNNLHD